MSYVGGSKSSPGDTEMRKYNQITIEDIVQVLYLRCACCKVLNVCVLESFKSVRSYVCLWRLRYVLHVIKYFVFLHERPTERVRLF